jgi:hypothetical protein
MPKIRLRRGGTAPPIAEWDYIGNLDVELVAGALTKNGAGQIKFQHNGRTILASVDDVLSDETVLATESDEPHP